ncbi:MAG: glycosyltransferase family A protein, partial [Chloroflexota bacterium]
MLSVIIPAYNAAPTLGDCLRALRQQSFAHDQYEVIVVDDGSTDETAAMAEQCGARIVRQPKRGPAAARNLGVTQARGEVVLFTDA